MDITKEQGVYRITVVVFLAVLMLLSACQPAQIIVVTATPTVPVAVPTATVETLVAPTVAPTSTNVPVRSTDTSTPTSTSTVVPTVAFSTARPTAGSPTPTVEAYRTDEACVLFTTDWDDPQDGCRKLRNGSMVEGLTVTNGEASPNRWLLWKHTAAIPVTCGVTGCVFYVSGTPPQAMAGIQQRATSIEKNQCYLIKGMYSYRVRVQPGQPDPNAGWPDNILFAIARIDDRLLEWKAFTKQGRPSAGDANFYWGVTSFIWPVRGGDNPSPLITLGLRSQWGSTQTGSTVNLFGAQVYAAPESYCDGAIPGF